MFQADRDLVSELKLTDAHFKKLFNEHNELDATITKLEKDPISAHRSIEIETLKKQKLHLKDELFKILEKHK